MKKIVLVTSLVVFFTSLVVFFTSPCLASPPYRSITYTSGTTIRAADVTSNEDAIFTYLQNGADTFADDSIYNVDVNSAAGILASKLNLSGVTQDISHSGTFTQGGSASFTTITDLGTVTTANIDAGTIDGMTLGYSSSVTITNADINDGTLDSVDIGITTPATGKFTTLKVGTTNQGDILYDNGTSLVRLTPSTSGYFLKTQGAAANPAWAAQTYTAGFGDSAAATEDAATAAATDGFLVMYKSESSNLAGNVTIKTDSANPPTTVVGGFLTTAHQYDTVTIPVKKGNYYFIDFADFATDETRIGSIWVPIN